MPKAASRRAKRAPAAKPDARVTRRLWRVYDRLLAHYGVQDWWPAESDWEIMVGAILTQNTSWQNVTRALDNLRRAGALEPASMRALELARLAELVRSAGFVTSKPKRLKTLLAFLDREYAGDPANLRGADLAAQRAQLLALNGIGPETADAILLYVARQPVFVIDAFTRRILARMGRWRAAGAEITDKTSYDSLQRLFMEHLPHDVALFGEFHALLDVHAKRTCTKRAPRCPQCPILRLCETGILRIKAVHTMESRL
jgi:endonuclease-3 related protein